LKGVKELAVASQELLKKAKIVISDPSNNQFRSDISNQFKNVGVTITNLLDAAKQGAVGEKLTDEALQIIAKAIANLDAASLFAAAGQLEPSKELDPKKSASQSCKDVITLGKQIASIGSQLVQNAKGSQDAFGQTCKNVALNIEKLAVLGQDTGYLMGDMNFQQGILSHCKSVSVSAQQLINTGKESQILKDDQNILKTMQKSERTFAESIQGLISFIEVSESESSQGIEILVRAAKEVEKFLSEIDKKQVGDATAKDLVVAARKVATASALLTLGVGNKEQLIKGAEDSIITTEILLAVAKGASKLTDNKDISSKVNSVSKSLVETMKNLLNDIKEHTVSGIGAQQISDTSKILGDKMNDLISVARQLPGGHSLKLEEDSGEDLEEVANKELMSAVSAIEEATKFLLNSRPERKEGEKLKFDTSDISGAIIEAAISISKATTVLVTSAANSQSERIKNQKSNPVVFRKDPMWANGLISAAKQVAGAVQQLVKSASNSVEGKAEEEELVAVARMVASSTAQLVSASRAKSDSNSKNHQFLMDAAKTVANATSQLVTAAKNATKMLQEEQEEELASNYTGSAVKQLEQQMKVLKLEKELEKARQQMLGSRKQEYTKK